MSLDSKGRNDLAQVRIGSLPSDASPQVIADLESIQRRVNALLRRSDIHNGKIAAVTNAPPSTGSGISGNFGPLSNLSFSNGFLAGGNNFVGTANGQMLVWNNDTTSWVIVAMSGDGSISKTGALTLIDRLTAGSAGSATKIPVLTWNAKGFFTAVSEVDISSNLAEAGTAAGQMLYWNGSAWKHNVAGADSQTLAMVGTVPTFTSFLKTDIANSRVVIGNPGTPNAAQLQVWGAGSAAPMLTVTENVSANNSTALSLSNFANANTYLQLAVVGAPGDYGASTLQKDGVLRLGTSTARTWFVFGTTHQGVIDTNGLVLGSVAAAGARLDVTGGTGITGLFTGASAQVVCRMAGTTATPVLDLTNTSTRLLDMTNSATMAATSGSTLVMASTGPASASGQRYAQLAFGKNVTGTFTTLASILIFSEEDNTTNRGTKMQFGVGTLGAASQTTRFELRGNGDAVLNASGAEPAVGTTGVLPWTTSVNGVPTGAPANSYTGAIPFLFDRAHNSLFFYNPTSTTWVTPKQRLIINSYSGTALTTSKTIDPLTDYQEVDTSSGGIVNTTLPDAATRGSAPVIVKSKIGAAANVTVGRAGSDTIDGGTTAITLTVGQRCTLVANGTNWNRID